MFLSDFPSGTGDIPFREYEPRSCEKQKEIDDKHGDRKRHRQAFDHRGSRHELIEIRIGKQNVLRPYSISKESYDGVSAHHKEDGRPDCKCAISEHC